MLSDEVPNYVIRYSKQLNEVKWIWFYAQMLEAVMITDELDYMFYVLKWILKTNFHDLAYEMYFILHMSKERFLRGIIPAVASA
ncbi:MAG: hypothetical protein AB6733_20445 [Clostridiaceae bacterium]